MIGVGMVSECASGVRVREVRTGAGQGCEEGQRQGHGRGKGMGKGKVRSRGRARSRVRSMVRVGNDGKVRACICLRNGRQQRGGRRRRQGRGNG